MHTTIEPSRFTGLPLLTTATAENDFAVTIDELRAGRIMLRPVANGEARWFWTITGPALQQAGMGSCGEADTLAGAKKAFREQFDRWLQWALAHDRAVVWYA